MFIARPAQTNAEFTAWGNPGAAMLYAQLVELRNRRLELDRQLAAAGARRQQIETALAAVPASATRALDLRARYESLQEDRRSVTAQLQSLEWLTGTSPVPYHRLRPAGPADADARSPWMAAGRDSTWKCERAGDALSPAPRKTRRLSVWTAPEHSADLNGPKARQALNNLRRKPLSATKAPPRSVSVPPASGTSATVTFNVVE